LKQADVSKVLFSAVIPTWNESEWLPGLLRNLQEFDQIAEVVVADSNSSDGTRELAKHFGARVVQGGRPGMGRNAGAACASHGFLLLADADAAIPRAALDRAEQTLAADSGVAAVHFPIFPIGASVFVRLCYRIMDLYIRAASFLGVGQGVGTCIAVRKESFMKVGGFKEELGVGEDTDFLRRLSRVGAVRYDRTVPVGTSSRRFQIENPVIFAGKTLMWTVLRLLGAPFSVSHYKWQEYPAGLGNRDAHLYASFLRKWS
jgi:glycosyltransferase involved in cell wall biosynthesis